MDIYALSTPSYVQMNVLYISTWFPVPTDNGSRLRAYHLLKALGAVHRTTLVSFDPAQGHSYASAALRDLPLEGIFSVPIDPFRNARWPAIAKYFSPIPVIYWPCRPFRRTLELAIQGQEWDVIVAFQSPAGYYAATLNTTTPRLLDMDTSLAFQMWRQWLSARSLSTRARRWIRWRKQHHFEKRLLKRFTSCCVVSPAETKYLTEMRGRAAAAPALIPNGVDIPSHSLEGKEFSSHQLVFAGSLTYAANFEAMRWFLDEVYPFIRAAIPDVSLTITGSTKGVPLTRLKLDETVALTGYIPDVRPVVERAHVCVAPMWAGGGTRLKVLEAMALCTPVVATPLGAEGLAVRDGQHVLIADSAETFADAVIRLLRDPQLCRRLSEEARHLVENQYDWRVIGHQFVKLVEHTACNTMGLTNSTLP